MNLQKIKWNNITKASLIIFFSSLYFYLPITTLWYQSRGLNLTQIASLNSFVTLTIFLFNVPTGIIADKFGRKLAIVLSIVLQLLGELLFLFAHSYLWFAIISVIAGLGFSFWSGAFSALILDSLKNDPNNSNVQKTVGNVFSLKGLATVIGAAASSFILSQLTTDRFVLAILITIISVAISFVISLFLIEPKISSLHKTKAPQEIIMSGLTLLKGNKKLLRIFLLGIFTTTLIAYLQNLYQPFFQKLNVPGPWFGLSLSIGGLLTILSLRYAYFFEKRLGSEKALFIFTLLPGILYLFLAADPRVVVMERTNILFLDSLPEKIDLATIDVTFTSLTKILPVVEKFTKNLIALLKPQYEDQKLALKHHGVIPENYHQEIIKKFSYQKMTPSPILGGEGNKEYLLYFPQVKEERILSNS